MLKRLNLIIPYRLISTTKMTSEKFHGVNKRQSSFKTEQGRKKTNNTKKDVVVTETISKPLNKDAVDKLSHVELSSEQQKLKSQIMSFVRENLTTTDSKPALFVIEGDAGTGKSVILNSLFNEIQKLSFQKDMNEILSGTDNYLVVNHPEMLKLYHRIARSFPYISIKNLERPTSLINKLAKDNNKCDLIIVDEAHLLSTSKDAFKRFYGENHLEELMKLCKVMVIVYDEKQSLRMGSYWSNDGKNGSSLEPFLKETSVFKRHYLKEQFRVTGDKDVQDWILALSTTKKIAPYPILDLKKIQKGDKDAFDFKIWEDAGEMYEALKQKDKEYGQCRILCTYDFPYRLGNKDWFVTCGENFKLRWDRYLPKIQTPWSERADTIEEVGSVYTIQGFDLNYAGVILGRSIGYDEEKDEIKILPEYYDDNAGFTKKKNIKHPETVKEKIILNSINVLLTRGVRGLYVYAWNDKLRERLLRDAPVRVQ